MIKILVADDHAIIRRGVRQILSEIKEMEVSDEASSGQEVLEKVRRSDFDIVLLDLSMPGLSGIDILKQIKIERPGLPVVILSRHPEEQYALPLIKAGASGYVSKSGIIDELVQALRVVSIGKTYFNPALTEGLIEHLRHDDNKLPHMELFDREMDILDLIVSGKRIKDIARDLCLSETTVSTYRSRLLKKLNLKNTAELVRYAIERGLVE